MTKLPSTTQAEYAFAGFVGEGSVREDGRKLRNVYLFEVKQPAESKQPWDYYKVLATISPNDAFRSLSESECPLVKK